jgi:NAD(P)-dependent dehydrogenase (short-subunit alcohol dehydrogenase family)
LVASGRGKIVDITSAVGMFAVDGATPCADMASGARVGLVRSLAAEGAAGGIGVNGVLIGGADPDVAAAAATWLAHADCPDTSRFLLVGADISEGFGCAAHGYQSPRPARFDLEEIRDNWAEVKIRTGSLAPATIADYGAFRMGIYSETVTEAVS